MPGGSPTAILPEETADKDRVLKKKNQWSDPILQRT